MVAARFAPCLGVAAIAEQAAAAGKQRLVLPADSDAIILRWDGSAGLGPSSHASVLLLHASGKFSARPLPSNERRRTGSINADALQQLMIWIIDENRFATISAKAILDEIEAIGRSSGRIFALMDGGQTHIAVDLPALRHSVVLPALDAARSLFPEIDALRRLHAIKQRLLDLADQAR